MKTTTRRILIAAVTAMFLSAVLASCGGGSSGNSRSYVNYGVGYRGYYGPRPWGYYPGYGEVDPDWGVEPDAPVAVPLPEPGFPDMGMPDMGGMDFGGFDF